MLVKDMAYARSGDKGDVVNVGVLAFDDDAYQALLRTLTPERIKRHFGDSNAVAAVCDARRTTD